jgi:hypothetical protein
LGSVDAALGVLSELARQTVVYTKERKQLGLRVALRYGVL